MIPVVEALAVVGLVAMVRLAVWGLARGEAAATWFANVTAGEEDDA